jgi:chromatin remodeling complex protein RSC6
MRKVKWTAKGRNVWSINKYNKTQPHGFHVIVMELTVRNKQTGFKMLIRREFDTSVKATYNFFQEEQAMKAELQNDPDFIAAGRWPE